ncbi:MAG: UDP-N-acetylglucosamine 2-epimerase [Alphaproteobacteria bacterium]|nr:UDP-N-acetylglucosamine 2-epimerase [Alphaproteobacteria bacterium]
MTRILSVTSSRADVGILTPVWRALAEAGAEVELFATGMHQADDALAQADLPPGIAIHRGGADLGGAAPARAAAAMGEIERAAGALYADRRPDLVLATGDRLDMVPAAMATVPFNLPLAHLHGGEATEGAVDDRLRHAMSKLAHLHCVSSDGARRRLLALGEAAERITVTGAPGLDTLTAAPALSAADFADAVGLADATGLRLVTVHPETNAVDPLAAARAVLTALAGTPGPALVTAPNSDPGGAAIRTEIEAFCAAAPDRVFRETLGGRLFANALRHAAVMVGNSSSGVIEAGLFGLPVIDVGDRQAGREGGENVRRVPAQAAAVEAAIADFAARPGRFAPGTPYGDGRSGPRVARALLDGLALPGLLRKPTPPPAAVG